MNLLPSQQLQSTHQGIQRLRRNLTHRLRAKVKRNKITWCIFADDYRLFRSELSFSQVYLCSKDKTIHFQIDELTTNPHSTNKSLCFFQAIASKPEKKISYLCFTYHSSEITLEIFNFELNCNFLANFPTDIHTCHHGPPQPLNSKTRIRPFKFRPCLKSRNPKSHRTRISKTSPTAKYSSYYRANC